MNFKNYAIAIKVLDLKKNISQNAFLAAIYESFSL